MIQIQHAHTAPCVPQSYIGFNLVFPFMSIWSQKTTCTTGYKCWWISKWAPLQLRVNQNSPKAVIIYAGDIYSRWFGIIIYQKFMFLHNLHYINHSLSKDEGPASGSVIYLPQSKNSEAVAVTSSIAYPICVLKYSDSRTFFFWNQLSLIYKIFYNVESQI